MPDADKKEDAKGGTGRRTRGVMPEPSEASKGRPVPKPLHRRAGVRDGGRQIPPAEGAGAGDAATEPGSRRPTLPAGPPATGAPPSSAKATEGLAGRSLGEGRPGPGGITRQTASPVTRPGITQASLGGGAGGPAGGGFTTHKVRSEDRVNVDVDVAVSYRFVSQEDPKRFPTRFRGKLLDISMRGAQIEGPIAPEIGRDELKRRTVTVEAALELPFVEDLLEIAATVNWIKPSSHPRSYMGLRFVNPTAEQKRIIRAFLIGLQSPTRRRSLKGR